ETTLKVARDYISLFFGKRVNQNLVDDLNPLNEVEVHFGADGSQFQTRYLGFDFRRVLVDDELSHLLVSVSDITDRVSLERELQESRAHSSAQLDMLMDILHIEPEMLTDFLCGSERALGKINSILKRPAKGAEVYKAKLDQIFREVHTVKGEACALGLQSVEIHAHELEDLIVEIQSRPVVRGTDFLPLTIKLDELLGHVQSVRELVARLIDFRSAFDRSNIAAVENDQRAAPRTDLSALLHNLAERIGTEQGKRVNVHCIGLEGKHVPEIYRGPVKDMAVQLIRNGVTHGIETPDERLQINKGQVGRIAMKFIPLGPNGGFEFSYRDDGRGLNIDLIRRTAVEKGFVGADQVEKMDERALMALIFQRGFSTSEVVSTDAGRGVGMDVIRNLVNELDGRVRVSTARGEYTQFKITLPSVPHDLDQAA
ncbi:MAG: ATP-binding protein, partial [Gammaproteobacteria bacterium]|nr:ATP-binding protein [Gammaproteobacteria bacterium]